MRGTSLSLGEDLYTVEATPRTACLSRDGRLGTLRYCLERGQPQRAACKATICVQYLWNNSTRYTGVGRSVCHE